MKDTDLIGKTITKVEIAEDKMAMRLTLSDGEMLIRVDADCCSHTWIEHVEMPTELPALVTAVGDIELNADADTRDGELAFYGYRISTNQGDLVIDYRNESNGYYGGSIVFGNDEYFYGGVYSQNVSDMKWAGIK
jgi:hypothetical protein